MKIQRSRSSQQVTVEHEVQYVVIPDMSPQTVVYRLTTTKVTTTTRPGAKPREDRKEVVREGLCRKGLLTAFLQGKADSLACHIWRKDGEDLRGGALCYVSDELLHFLQFRGADWLPEERNAYYAKHGELGPPRPEVSDEPFTALTEGGSFDNVAYIDWGNHQAWDRQERALPVARSFSYISARMHNGCYDLERAAAILQARDDVVLFAKRWGDRLIHTIPHYNATSSQTHHLSFLWQPTAEDCRKVEARCQEIGGKYPSTNWRKAVFDLDLLGLRAGGAAKYDDFWGNDKDEDENEEY